jgi:hypothetical protein
MRGNSKRLARLRQAARALDQAGTIDLWAFDLLTFTAVKASGVPADPIGALGLPGRLPVRNLRRRGAAGASPSRGASSVGKRQNCTARSSGRWSTVAAPGSIAM